MAQVNKMMMNMGMPQKAPYGTLILGRNCSNPSCWLNVEGSTWASTQCSNPSHRQSASDSLITIEKANSCLKLEKTIGDGNNEVDEIKMAVNPSSDDRTATTAGSSIKTEPDQFYTQHKWGRKIDPNMDPRKIKRILANRQSAQKSRLRKLEYMSDLEKKVNALEAEVKLLSPQIGYYDRQRLKLRMENSAMKQRLVHLMGDTVFKDAQFQALKEEGERLKQLYILQQQQPQNMKMNTINLDYLNCYM